MSESLSKLGIGAFDDGLPSKEEIIRVSKRVTSQREKAFLKFLNNRISIFSNLTCADMMPQQTQKVKQNLNVLAEVAQCLAF
jgi:hypothetical protein